MPHELKKDWITEAGLRAVVLFVNESHHCGYVELWENHPLEGIDYDQPIPGDKTDIDSLSLGRKSPLAAIGAYNLETNNFDHRPDIIFDVHGGITYSGWASDEEPYPVADSTRFWYGFDCAHATDVVLRVRSFDRDATFKDLNYVAAECESLAKQLLRYSEATQ